MPWQVEGVAAKYGCWRRACAVALTRAKKGWSSTVRWVGHKKQFPNSDPMNLDFVMHADGSKDYSIDPTWSGHPTPP
jgi:hypothetical protein